MRGAGKCVSSLRLIVLSLWLSPTDGAVTVRATGGLTRSRRNYYVSGRITCWGHGELESD